MNEFGIKAENASLKSLGLGNVASALWNLEPCQVDEETIIRREGELANSG